MFEPPQMRSSYSSGFGSQLSPQQRLLIRTKKISNMMPRNRQRGDTFLYLTRIFGSVVISFCVIVFLATTTLNALGLTHPANYDNFDMVKMYRQYIQNEYSSAIYKIEGYYGYYDMYQYNNDHHKLICLNFLYEDLSKNQGYWGAETVEFLYTPSTGWYVEGGGGPGSCAPLPHLDQVTPTP